MEENQESQMRGRGDNRQGVRRPPALGSQWPPVRAGWSLLAANAAKTLFTDHDQLLSGEAPDKLPGHGCTKELLIGPSWRGDPGLGP